MTHRSIQLLAALAAGTLVPASALASSSGKTGSSTTGCTSCHGTTASSDTTVSFSTSSTDVDAGDTITVTFTVANSGQSAYGMNVSGTGGTFGAGTGTKVSSGEVTHDGKSTSDTFTFEWTAPATAGTYTLSGAGNAVNNNGANSGDEWNLAPDLVLTVCTDDDGDGVTDCDGDCDDSDASAYPGNTEVCDGVDNDCNGSADDGLTTYDFYTDGDGDGYGSGSVSLSDCDATAPTGYSDVDTDCDDSDSAVNPGAAEVCDSVDNDCDGSTDEDLATYDYYTDADGDGYGSGAVSLSVCDESAPTGYSDLDTDCDDTNGDTFPGAPEICDSLDNDCDTDVDEDATPVDWYPDADGDGYGDASAEPTNSCTQPTGSVTDNTDCDDAEATTYPGADDTWYDGVDSDCAGDDDYDADMDGFASSTEGSGRDCDDSDADVNPDATETWYDGVDSDCDEASDYDADMDGYDSSEFGGEDCDDTSTAFNPDATETANDDIDNNCDGYDPIDADGDGVPVEDGGEGPFDCDDNEATVYPGQDELPGDGLDNDCDEATSDEYDPIAEVGDYKEEKSGCATASAPLALGAWAGLVAVFGLVRRRED